MHVTYYRFGTVIFQILSPSAMRTDPRFEAFAVDEAGCVDFTFEIQPRGPGGTPAEASPVPTERSGNHIKAFMDTSLIPKISIANFLSGVRADQLLPEKELVMLHCSYVLHQGKALLFCAPSGTGKSTQARFWNQARNTQTVNEDRAIIGKARGRYYAHGCWAMGQGTVCRNISAPIHAIILLGQGSENRVYHPHPLEALRRLIPQCSFDDKSRVQREKMIDFAADLIGAVPILGFDCVNDRSSVAELEKYL